MVDIISGKYEVISQAGKGGMGVVYKVRHLTLETILALKMLPAELAENPEVMSRFHQEAWVMAQLRHPNIVRVLDVDRDGNTHYFVMEYVEGKNLSQRLHERGPLSLPEVLEISWQVTRALDYAHSHKPPVIHRDIKPENILIEELSGRAVVTDFGIAKLLGAGQQTRTGLMLGTLLYCAPEQILQNNGLDGRADLYSLGLVMYEMATGRPFFAGLDERALLGRVLHGPGENVPTFVEPVSPEFVTLVTRAIARDREHRYQQAADLLRDIETCLALHSSTALSRRFAEPKTFTREPARTSELRVNKQEERREAFPKWFRKPRLRLRISVLVSLMVLALLSYRLVNHFQRQARDEHRQTLPVSSPLKSETRAEQEDKRTIASPEPIGKEDHTAGPVIPQLTEQPVSPPRRYRVTILTAVRDKPTWTGEKVARIKPNTKIHVVAIAGDWLKVKSRSHPPKPPGYVWKEDTRPD